MKRLVGLQWGRAIAAVTVVITHAIVHPYPGVYHLAHLGGRFGVTLFFVISGYIMVATTGAAKFQPMGFMKKRVLRVAPLYYFATAVAVAGVLIAPWAFKDTVFDIRHIVLSILFIPTPEPGAIASVDPFLRLGWTLNFEMFFYLVFAALFAFSALTRAMLLTALFGALIILGQVFKFTAQPIEFYTRIDTLGFVFGVWLAVLSTRYNWRLSRAVTWMVTGLGAVSALGLALAYPSIPTSPWTQVWLVITCTLIIGVLALAGNDWEKVVPGWMTYLGDASYSMYLFHMFAVGGVTVLLIKRLPHEWLYFLIGVSALAGIAIGVFVYRFIETPMNNVIRRWAYAPSASAALGGTGAE